MAAIELYTLLELVGTLNDNTEPSSASGRLRKYLRDNISDFEDVRAYINDALARSGDQFNKALQDLINHLGELLGFKVTYGRYRGTKGQIGFDGVWRSPDDWALVVETKTTDVYTVKTAPVLGYINGLVSEGLIKDPSHALGLYIYGRFDQLTSQLENAIIVEGRRERLRVVSVDALINLLELKQVYNLDHETILGLLLPAPVKVDSLVNLILNIVAQEKDDIDNENEPDLSPSLFEEKSEQATLVLDTKPIKLIPVSVNYTGKNVKALTFRNHKMEIPTWKEGLLALCGVLIQQNENDFERVALSMVGRKRPYITYDKERLRVPERIPDTSLFFETNLSANYIVKICFTLIAELGYQTTDLKFEVE